MALMIYRLERVGGWDLTSFGRSWTEVLGVVGDMVRLGWYSYRWCR